MMMDLSNLSKFPMNTRNYYVVPCIQLTHENMHESLIGLKVTIGLGVYEGPTDSGIITGYDDSKIHIKTGSKVKKFDYDPVSIQLQVYQFDKRIMFSNDRVSEKELAASHREFYNEGSVNGELQPTQKKESNDVTKKTPTRKEKKPVQKKQPVKKSTSASSSYTPKFGIQWS